MEHFWGGGGGGGVQQASEQGLLSVAVPAAYRSTEVPDHRKKYQSAQQPKQRCLPRPHPSWCEPAVYQHPTSGAWLVARPDLKAKSHRAGALLFAQMTSTKQLCVFGKSLACQRGVLPISPSRWTVHGWKGTPAYGRAEFP